MRPACGAGSAGSPIPMPPWRMLPSCRITIGKTRTNDGHDRGHDLGHFHLPGRAAEDLADLQVLDEAAGDAAGAADDGRDAEHRADAGEPGHAEADHQERGDDQRREGEAGDRLVGAAHEADEVAADRGEEEARHHHDDGRHRGADEALAEVVVDRGRPAPRGPRSRRGHPATAGPSRCAGARPRCPRWKAPRKASPIEPRIPHIVRAAPTSIAPTAIGRIWLYQTEKTISVSGGAPCAPVSCGGRSGSGRGRAARAPARRGRRPAKLMAESSNPMM